ncbi:iron (metal) dependent repressor, DtxR family [Sulfobacillus acidophilus TPY]|jgi:DtxR family manganese transport transcriptional regulator|nr:iron (metal) dependent repressor, DtxR family [Sulfobacillus acidophilus TPY]
MAMATPSQEDYLEVIWTLIQEKGYARVADVAERLGISAASASKMVQRLHHEGLLTYERYRGFNLTPMGYDKGRRLVERHRVLERLLTHLALGTASDIYHIVEGIEHHFSVESLEPIRALVDYIEAHPGWWNEFRQTQTAGGPHAPPADAF